MNSQSLELLMPAGSYEKLRYAYLFGADAAYAGVPLFSLRTRENEISLQQLGDAYAMARSMGKKLYLTANVFARNLKIKPFMTQIEEWAKLQPDALIMSDPGLISIVKDKYPEIPIHLSVQANCMNWKAVQFWQKIGVERVILSRELRLDEIREIKQRVPEMELEAFVHGAICIAYSGRCLLSHYMSYRDANQGACDNSCRYSYKLHKAESTQENEDYYLEDLREKGKFYEITEDEHGTYIMNAKDLRLIEHLKEISDAGVCSFKVEGRTKSIYYVAMVARAYRQALNDLQKGQTFNPVLLDELEKVANRGYDKAFMLGSINHTAQNYADGGTRAQTRKFAGLVMGQDQSSGRMIVDARGTVESGQECEVISPNESFYFKIGNMYDQKGNLVTKAHSGAGTYHFDVNFPIPPNSILSLIHQ